MSKKLKEFKKINNSYYTANLDIDTAKLKGDIIYVHGEDASGEEVIGKFEPQQPLNLYEDYTQKGNLTDPLEVQVTLKEIN